MKYFKTPTNDRVMGVILIATIVIIVIIIGLW